MYLGITVGLGGAPPKRSLLSSAWNRPVRLYAGVAKHNAAAIRVLQKSGFVHFEDDGPTHILLKLDAKL